ncbi:biopolymer transporter ExbD [Vibrio sp. UCD-FRSSP16_10]|uniref:ExbD/TolR family protein n=1 Tax=unclassified Vibrio TaxID=2614977 RepID=UPI0008001176|nr:MULTISPECIES: biopolymer transporter ExbD [unclassified Vibrio]OBT15511.1 biopolymer transporter ExbD [Vibrio sp. UCD-FRSSP16_30]OBT20584.1 biopolymer transporter ExbD [Vibrio sp. UCD-FRSSP16_10]
MIKSQSSLFDEEFKPDLTPLLDIIFIVMVFLLLTANITIKTMDVAIPQTDDGQVLNAQDKAVITVNIMTTEPKWAIDGESFADWSAFTHALLSKVTTSPEHDLILSPDKSADVESMLKVLAWLQTNEINATNIVMEESK